MFVPTVTSTVGPATPVPTPVAQKPSDDGPKLPDLLVTAVVWEPTVPTMGEDVQVIVTIENNGTLAADKTLLQFLVQERTTAEAALARLDPGETVTQKFVWEAASGVDTIGAFVDPENVVEESNETNNRVNINFGGVTAADLAIRNIVWEPEDPDVGDKVTFTVTIENQGEGKSPSSMAHYYVDDDIRLESDEIGAVPAGEVVTTTFTWTVEAGTHTLEAVADATGLVEESVETNNRMKVTLSSGPLPDLSVESITWQPSKPSEGELTTLSLTIGNKGEITAVVASIVLYVDGVRSPYSTGARPEIDPGGTEKILTEWRADPGNLIDESDETNNELTVDYDATALADLVVENVTSEPDQFTVGDRVAFIATVRNKGTGTSLPTIAEFFLDAQADRFDVTNLKAIEPGATRKATFGWVAKDGAHEIRVVIDGLRTVTESDETNNETTVVYDLTGSADLVVDSVVLNPADHEVGDKVTFSVTVRNQGIGQAGASTVEYYIGDETSRFGMNNLRAISGGGVGIGTFEWVAEEGAHSIRILLDTTDAVSESDETNNEEVLFLELSEPAELVIQSITWTPESPSVGDDVTFTVTVRNDGPGAAFEAGVELYLGNTSSPFASEDIGTLDADDTIEKTFTWVAEKGTHILTAVADARNIEVDADEPLNEKAVSYEGTLLPDLVLDDFTWRPEKPAVGDIVTYIVTIVNEGVGIAKSFTIDYFLFGRQQPFKTDSIDELQPGAAVTATFQLEAEPELATIIVVIDPEFVVTESDELNNGINIVFPGAALAELVVTRFKGVPEVPQEGGTVTFSVTIANRGSGRARPFTVEYYLGPSDESFGSDLVQGISAGKTSVQTFTWVAEPGQHIFTVVLDTEQVVVESDERNNEEILAFPSG